MNIREWIYRDARSIASVHVKSWQTTYRGIISDDYLDGLDVSERAKKWEEILSDKDQKIFVVLDWEDIVGFATCGKSDEMKWFDSNISSIYILEEYQWKNIWRSLFQKCKEHLSSIWCKTLFIWVLKDNTARKFYEKIWGKFLEEKEIFIGKEKYLECAYSWDI